MTINNINIDATLKKVNSLLAEEKELSPTMRAMVELLILLVTMLVNRLNVNSRKDLSQNNFDIFR